MRCLRIGDSRFPLFDATGSRLYGGRWNSPGSGVIYAAETYAGAILEILAHTNMYRLPRTHAVIAIDIPDDIAIERLTASSLPGWNSANQRVSRAFGDAWIREARTLALMVPALVTQGREHNVLINPAHPGFSRVTHSQPEPVEWDERLFRI